MRERRTRATLTHAIASGAGISGQGTEKLLSTSARVLALLFGILVVGALLVYGVKVHLEDDINQMARKTRELNERNKELQVRLNQIRSYKNVEAKAAGVPHLRRSETIIDVSSAGQPKLPAMPTEKRESLHVYGY